MTAPTRSKPDPHAALPAESGGSLISDARLTEIYAAMLKCRMLRERIRALAGPVRLRAFALASEAVAAAAVIGLMPEDTVISTAPHLFAALLKGVPLASLLRPPHARPSAAKPAGGTEQAYSAAGVLAVSFHGARRRQLSASALAAGAAFAARHGNRSNVVVVSHEDAPHEIFAFALAHRLPVIFIRQSARPLQSRSRLNRACVTLPIIPVDSNDAVAVYRVACEAVAHARRGSGPTLIDCVPVRLPGERKQDSDCIAKMERYLAAKGLRPERIKASVAAEFTHALDAAVSAARPGARAGGRTRGSGK